MPPRRPRNDARVRRERQLVGLAGFAAAAALPVVLWHRAIALVASDFRLELGYLTGWLGYALIGAGLLLLVPVAISAGSRPDSRIYPRGRRAYMGWGVSLYLLGLMLAVEVAAVVR